MLLLRKETMPTFSVRELIGENFKENSENNLFDNIPEHLKELFKRSINNLDLEQSKELAKLLIHFQDIFSKNELDIGHYTQIKHIIDSGNAAPVKERMRRTPIGFEK